MDVSIDSEEDALEAARSMVAAGTGLPSVTLAEQGLVYVTSEGHGRIRPLAAT